MDSNQNCLDDLVFPKDIIGFLVGPILFACSMGKSEPPGELIKNIHSQTH